jgi:hypothetical protein
MVAIIIDGRGPEKLKGPRQTQKAHEPYLPKINSLLAKMNGEHVVKNAERKSFSKI